MIARQTQWEINRDYKQAIAGRAKIHLEASPIGASVDVYKNGEFVKTVNLGGGTVPPVIYNIV